jgi:CRISPR-associated protein Csm3
MPYRHQCLLLPHPFDQSSVLRCPFWWLAAHPGEIELKSGNVIDRETSTAEHPRKEERVVAGSKFSLRIGIQVWDMDNTHARHDGKTGADALIALVKDGLRALQQTGLGSGVSKGSGEIEFRDLKLDGQSFTL